MPILIGYLQQSSIGIPSAMVNAGNRLVPAVRVHRTARTGANAMLDHHVSSMRVAPDNEPTEKGSKRPNRRLARTLTPGARLTSMALILQYEIAAGPAFIAVPGVDFVEWRPT
jgi:hypothetical protein